MTLSFLRAIGLVTLGAVLLGHGAFRFAGRRAPPGAGRASFLVGAGSIAVGLEPMFAGIIASALLIVGLLLLGAGAIAAARGRGVPSP